VAVAANPTVQGSVAVITMWCLALKGLKVQLLRSEDSNQNTVFNCYPRYLEFSP
jgi:hypothetical protein